jgi:hypothetical protein
MRKEITKEQIKAIRIVNGFNPDLRVKLSVNRNTLWNFIDENFAGLFGIDTLDYQYEKEGVLSWQYDAAVRECVDAVCAGEERTFDL